jgi:aspartate/methionine/tyrosine aminotransferase
LHPKENLAMNYFLCASAPAQYAARACFTPEMLAICEQRRGELLIRVWTASLESDCPCPAAPAGAFYAYFDITGTGLDSWTFCERALEYFHVALTPGRDFGTTTADSHVRLPYAASRDQLHEGLARLGNNVATLQATANPAA